MKVVVSVVDLCAHMKLYTLCHVHHKIDEAQNSFMQHKCPHTFMRDIGCIGEVSNMCIVDYIKSVDSCTESAHVSQFAKVHQ